MRDFKTEDFELLWRMDQECFAPGIAYSKQELRAYIRNRGSFTLVAADSDQAKPQGFIVVQGGSTSTSSRLMCRRAHGAQELDRCS